MKNEIIKINDINNRQDYMSIDKKSVISSEGLILHVGDTVYHDGADGFDQGIINSFFINEESYDIIARTTMGEARISFLYTK